MHAAILSLLLSANPAPAPDTIVICPREMQPALRPWIAHRQAQGHTIAIANAMDSAERVRDRIRHVANSGKLRNIVLVGDAKAASGFSVSSYDGVPTRHIPARINVNWGSEPEIATDNWYADLDDDQVPDVAIGRLTADSPKDLSLMVRKIVKYESAPRSGSWRRRLNFVAGVGGFGAIVDSVLETATKKFLTDGVPAAYDMSMTYGSWRSPFCPDPRRFHDATLRRLNEGCLFWVYIGHGQRRYLDSIRVPGGAYRIFDTDDVASLQSAGGAPIAVFLSCYTGAFDGTHDCLAEEMLRSPDGPIAVYSGSRVTMPYAMAVMGNELMSELFQEQRETLGEIILNAKRNMVAPAPELDPSAATNRQLLDAIAAVISPAPDMLDAERLEHVQLFNLLGDPLLRVRHPHAVELTVAETVHAGERIKVQGTTSVGGICRLELVCRRDRTRNQAPIRGKFDPSDQALTSFSRIYAEANDRRWAAETFTCKAGEFTRELVIPADAHGPCHVRVFIDGHQHHALGVTDVFVKRAAIASNRR